MTVTLIFLVVILVIALIFIPFSRQILLDKQELAQTPINEKFKVLVEIINDKLFDGRGEVTLFDDDPRSMNLFSDDMSNYLIQFYYSTGNLTITLNYKYYHNELVHKEQYSGLRNLSIFMQKDIAYSFLEVCQKQIELHRQKVSAGDVKSKKTQAYGASSADPTNILSSVYEELTQSQKQSVINLMYHIASASGKSESELKGNTAINQQLLILNLNWEQCMHQYKELGTSRIISDLKGIDDGIMVSILLGCLQMVHEIVPQATDPTYTPVGECFLQIFADLGYTEEKISATIEKIKLLQQAFGQ